MANDELLYGDDPNHPKYSEGYQYEIDDDSGIKINVRVVHFSGNRDGKNHYWVEYSYLIGSKQFAPSNATITEEDITRRAFIDPSGFVRQ